MAQFLNNMFGGAKSAASPVPSGDSDFADFAQATAAAVSGAAAAAASAAGTPAVTAPPYTKWYNVHERYTLNDFRNEGLIFVVMAVVFTVHLIGSRRNRSKAHAWFRAHAKLLTSEFALVGFGSAPHPMTDLADEAAAVEELAKKTEAADPKTLMKENSLFEYATYATGRQNVAFVDVKLELVKRFNPFVTFAESILSFFIDSVTAPTDVLSATLYSFDGKEALTVPRYSAVGVGKSTYDGFVWAIVNKERMKGVRDERFDVSLTFTKDNAKLPAWLTVMSESAEITDALLTPELIQAVEAAGEDLDYIIISDQPVIKPVTIDETAPRKRVFLKYRLPANNNYETLLPIFAYFLRSADVLVQSAHLRPEVLRKVKNIREETVRQIKKADEDEKAEERALERERLRKQKRDNELNALDAKAQKKYLEREREKEIRRSSKRTTMRA
ncbi:duf1682 domain containing protein [Grosmannia clavigera kw1407]|uniref:Duf1682 domain containing protein n=1 Tax=Grosmannia clavigera (strain kw1407 / UAMH 11150) TaxID=655863 RepID=F0XC43_GROCL|nr:duf1682 domain containing protein [Grosmannia clavigera kw1407]EFX03704.1 duf1682 domain containing protein [Grosmannia clavigera kw1407]